MSQFSSWRGDRLARWVLAAFSVVFITGIDLPLGQELFPTPFSSRFMVFRLHRDAISLTGEGLCRGTNARQRTLLRT